MTRTTKAAVALVAALALTSGCGDGSTPAGEASSTYATPATSAQAGTGQVTGAPATNAAPAPGATDAGEARPVTEGNGKCLDLASPTVRDAVAKLPPFRGDGYVATRGTDAKAGACPDLMWVRADLNMGTGSSPVWFLFFDRLGYLGTATSRYTAFTSVFGSTQDSVALEYRWLNPGDATAGPSGGPVIVTYRLSGRTVTADKEVPPQVFDGGAAPTTEPTRTAAPTSATPTAPAAAPTSATATSATPTAPAASATPTATGR
ncbi:LppP/LprE family lipoprotein [Tsukamurella asaccharolytica]|uniref:LppP/LprE family lipoprotein n=1 Tax=Tsukamurella asaccharolytica TaxID=2592067 RepID=A0A5C5RAF5_9ACTN|nr:LppP/LprE family lipoprotein [Tsukamurella asaccharolytica]TWS19075.1 LppP/LprE family lipoprotein [Tsukamurella asaccharolytica]